MYSGIQTRINPKHALYKYLNTLTHTHTHAHTYVHTSVNIIIKKELKTCDLIVNC